MHTSTVQEMDSCESTSLKKGAYTPSILSFISKVDFFRKILIILKVFVNSFPDLLNFFLDFLSVKVSSRNVEFKITNFVIL